MKQHLPNPMIKNKALCNMSGAIADGSQSGQLCGTCLMRMKSILKTMALLGKSVSENKPVNPGFWGD
jgi:hypothetical protein